MNASSQFDAPVNLDALSRLISGRRNQAGSFLGAYETSKIARTGLLLLSRPSGGCDASRAARRRSRSNPGWRASRVRPSGLEASSALAPRLAATCTCPRVALMASVAARRAGLESTRAMLTALKPCAIFALLARVTTPEPGWCAELGEGALVSAAPGSRAAERRRLASGDAKCEKGPPPATLGGDSALLMAPAAPAPHGCSCWLSCRRSVSVHVLQSWLSALQRHLLMDTGKEGARRQAGWTLRARADVWLIGRVAHLSTLVTAIRRSQRAFVGRRIPTCTSATSEHVIRHALMRHSELAMRTQSLQRSHARRRLPCA